MMKLVTVAKITLNRPGSITRGGFQGIGTGLSDARKTFKIILDEETDLVESVLNKVKELAASNGESESAVERLIVATPYDAPGGVMYFNERIDPFRGTQFSQFYAESEAFPALEINGRHFRLDEVIAQTD